MNTVFMFFGKRKSEKFPNSRLNSCPVLIYCTE